MVRDGGKISNTSLDQLRKKLAEEDTDPKAVKRLFTAIDYKLGESPATLEEKYGISENNIYVWLDRIEERGLEAALYDEPKPGRPPKLTDEEREELESVLSESPQEVGYDVDVWTPKFVQHWLEANFDVEYTLRHVRRLMKEAGLSWRTARPEHYEVDPEEVAEFKETFKKSDEN